MPPPLPFSQGSAWSTLRQEAKRMWPFAMGFAVTSILYTKVALGITGASVSRRCKRLEAYERGGSPSWEANWCLKSRTDDLFVVPDNR